ncbi:MAG: rhodanese-like domain-containing protein [Opitutaceae bacterium]|nr:rhodanese-like domain-containing protein [Opitutaceae bacterium]
MKLRHLVSLLLAPALAAFAADAAPKITPQDAAKLVASGKAVLVDVREAAECQETGLAAPALHLPKSDFDGAQKEWKDFLAKVGDKQVITYCRSGGRAGAVAAALNAQGVKAASVGSLRDWQAAGLPVRAADAPAAGSAAETTKKK